MMAVVTTMLVVGAATRGPAAALSLECLGAVPLGGVARVRLRVTPARRVKFSMHRMRARVVSAEVMGEDSTPDVYFEAPLALPIPLTLAQPFEHEWSIPIPRHVPPSWKGTFGELVTFVEVDLPYSELGGLTAKVQVPVLPELVHE